MESAWLIERVNLVGPPQYWTGLDYPDNWSTDSLHAVRFSRQQDGERVAKVINLLNPSVIEVREHQWSDGGA